ncbi:MAG TPA: polysaccharide deacetylase family protein [Gammaproteobacteria bacterium]|nr:polysaccharide deacetylase family protein [Gammaproteobacteria bacterium]
MRGRIPTALIGVLLLAGCESRAESGGVVFMYHHVDAGTPAATSVTPEVFAEQMSFLEREGFTVLPLIDLLDALAGGREVSARSVAITFDDGYRSVLTEALPLLESRGWPFTVFVNTEAIDEGYGGYLSWSDLRTLGERGGAIGNHSVTHAHLVRSLPGETTGEWRRRVTAEIESAADRLEAEVGDYLIPAFAYPYGEYSAEIKAIVDDAGLYGLGQHSGAVGPDSDFLALPRYPVATGLPIGDFALRARSLPLPVRVSGTEQHVVDPADSRPTLTLALDPDDDVRVAELACYVGGQGRAVLEWRDDGMRELSVRPERALGPGRTKVNCTAPSRESAGVYYWWGYLWMRRLDDGRWYEE